MTDTADSNTILTPDSKKRTYDQISTDCCGNALLSVVEPLQKDQSSIPTPSSGSITSSTSRQSSPLHSEAGSQPRQPPASGVNSGSSGTPIGKKRKLTVSEKMQRLQEKEERDREKLEQKYRREAETLAKAEEKRKKDEEKETAKRQKEFERAERQKMKDEKLQAKEERKRQEEEAKAKKERVRWLRN